MKFNNLHKYFLGISIICISQACTKGFESLNQDPTKTSSVTPSQMITGIEKSASDIVYSNTVNGTIGMLYAQYYAQTQKEQQSQYQLDEGANNTLWSLYSGPLSNANNVIQINQTHPDPGAKNEDAIVNIISVWLFQILTDTYGNVPYSQALQGNQNLTAAYQDSKSIYDSLINRLDKQIAALDESAPAFASGELIYNNDISKWKKLANSLKLRIGIRMADANPTEAQQIVEEAVKSGVFASADDEAKFPYEATIGSQYPFNEESGSGLPNDYQVTATLVNFLQQTSDPRLTIYARPATTTNTYVGKPYGIGSFEEGYGGYSYPGDAVYSPTFPGYVMSYAEVEFDLAEAAQRGWNAGGTAEDFYKKGVLASMSFWGVGDADANAYLTKNPYNAGDWRDVIGTQKWLALYNQGLESWFERNRLNFKNPNGKPLFVAPAESLDPSVTMVPYRLTYPIAEESNNHTNYENAVAQLPGGKDEKGIKLWWQVN